MTEQISKGIKLLTELVGTGLAAEKGSNVTFCIRLYLNKGEEVILEDDVISEYPEHVQTEQIDGKKLIRHRIELGKRRAIAGIEKSLYGMREGGYRKLVVSPHLAYREAGIPGRIPANALLRVELWVLEVQPFT